MAFGLLGPIDVTFVHDLMMLVLSCYAHVFRLSIIRIALRLLLSNVAMFCIWATCYRFLLLAVTSVMYCICQVDGTNIDPVDSLWEGDTYIQ